MRRWQDRCCPVPLCLEWQQDEGDLPFQGLQMTVKKLLDEVSYKMARDNQASRFQKFKSILHPNIVVRF